VSPSVCKRRIFRELKRLERLEFKHKIIIDVHPLASFGNQKVPPRFNNATVTERLDTNNMFIFQARILPQSEPYCQASFLTEIALPPEYPFKGPKIIFLDPIYHPNIHESDKLCCDSGFHGDEGYKPTTSLVDIIENIIHFIDNIPDQSGYVNAECFQEYTNDYPTFYKKALERTLSYGRPRY
jgi:ubiquitin-protein ligase